MQNLFRATPKPHFSKYNNISGSSQPFWYFASSSFPPLVSSDGTNTVLPSSKAEFFVQTFVSNSTLDDSGAVPTPTFHFISVQNCNFSYRFLLSLSFTLRRRTLPTV